MTDLGLGAPRGAPMTLRDLQQRLADIGVYTGAIDGKAGPLIKAAVIQALTIGHDNPATDLDFKIAADDLGVSVAKVRTIAAVEAAGDGFAEGRPKILFEGHRFSAATGGRFDRAYPAISYRPWDRGRYPGAQLARYQQLAEAVCLDVDAGFASASYGGFQILGENYGRCGYVSPWAFAWAQSQSEGDQLAAFVAFVKSDPALLDALRVGDWAAVARRYNGSAYKLNHYDERLAARFSIERRKA